MKSVYKSAYAMSNDPEYKIKGVKTLQGKTITANSKVNSLQARAVKCDRINDACIQRDEMRQASKAYRMDIIFTILASDSIRELCEGEPWIPMAFQSLCYGMDTDVLVSMLNYTPDDWEAWYYGTSARTEVQYIQNIL